MKWLRMGVCVLMAMTVLLSGCAASTSPSSSGEEPKQTRFETVGYYAYRDATQQNIDFWKGCGYDTIELLDIGWYFNPDKGNFDAYYTSLANDIARAQKSGLKVYVLLMTNLEQYHGPEIGGNGGGIVFDPADEVKMAERLGYIEHAIEQCAKADGFALFAGDPGGVSGLGIPGGLEYYVEMGRKVQDMVKKYAPQAEYNLNVWAVSQYVQATANPGTVDFWQGETDNTRELIDWEGLFGPDVGIEIPGHDYYRALAFTLYRKAGAFPEERFPTVADVNKMKAKQIPRMWGFSHFLLDELDDGDTAGHSRTELPSFNTRYIYKYINGIRSTGMNGVIAGCCSLNNAANLYAFGRMANDPTVTPEQVLREYATFYAKEASVDTLFEIFKFLENDTNWHQKLPVEDRDPLFETSIETPQQALELLNTVKRSYKCDFPVLENVDSLMTKLKQRIEMMIK